MIKLVCIKESETSDIKLGEIYYAAGEVVTVNDNRELDYMYCMIGLTKSKRQYWNKKYFILYNEWLALEREKQIKSILDD